MAKYTKKQAERGIRFWKKALTEAIAAESEEDQQKEKEEAAIGTDDTADVEDTDSADTTDTANEDKDKDAKISELEAKIAELEAQLADQDSEEPDEEPDEEEDSEDDSDEEEDDEEDDEEEDDEEEDDEELDESAPGSTQYAPNTVGAVCELLKKSDPNDKLIIRMNPGKTECMIIDIDRKITMSSGTTYMEIATGKPAWLREGKCKKACKK